MQMKLLHNSYLAAPVVSFLAALHVYLSLSLSPMCKAISILSAVSACSDKQSLIQYEG